MGAGSLVGAKRKAHFPQSPLQDSTPVEVEASVSMSLEGGNDNMTKDEKSFSKDFFDMIEMVKFLY